MPKLKIEDGREILTKESDIQHSPMWDKNIMTHTDEDRSLPAGGSIGSESDRSLFSHP